MACAGTGGRPNECCDCTIGSDDFSANDGNPHAGWTDRPAIYSTAGGDEATNTGGVLHFGKPDVQKFNTANPEGASSPTAIYAKFKMHETVTGDGVSLVGIIGYVDDDNYLFAQVDRLPDDASCIVNGGVGSGQITLWKREAGVNTALRTASGFVCGSRIDGLTLDVWHEIWVCLIPNNYGTYGDGDTLRARVKLNGVTSHNPGCQGVADGFTSGTYAALGNAPVSVSTYGEVEFDDFKYQYFRGTDHLSCPNCNGPCPIFSDSFTYSDTEIDAFGNLNCLWLVAGKDEIAAGVARFLDEQLEIESGALVWCRVPHPTAKSSKIVTVNLKWEEDIIARIDLGTGYVLLDEAAGEIQLYDNDDNLLDSVSGLPGFDDAMHEVEVCYEGGILTATAFGECVSEVSPDTGDPFVYLGSDGGTVHFDSFVFKKHRDYSEPKDGGCAVCDCPAICLGCCTDPVPAGAYLIDMGAGGWTSTTCADFSADPASCDACADVTGEFIVLFTGIPCTWEYQQSNCEIDPCCESLCSDFRLTIELALISDMTGCRWRVTVTIAPKVVDPRCQCYEDPGLTAVSSAKVATYTSDYLDGTTKCRTVPVTLTNHSESGTFPCNGSLPSTIELLEAM